MSAFFSSRIFSVNRSFAESHPVASPKKYQWIDALRGVAILLVIAVHTFSTVPTHISFVDDFTQNGQFGVQLFFVLSAITLCLSHRAREGELNAIENFYIRRYFRIAPAYYIGIATYFILNIALNYLDHRHFSPEYQYPILSVLANVFLVHGVIPFANNNAVPGGWSIGAEVIFYLLFPFIWKIQEKMRITWLCLTAVFCVFISFCFVHAGKVIFNLSAENNQFLYFSIINQFPVFIIGVITYRIFNEGRTVKMPILWFFISCALTMFLVSTRSEEATPLMPFTSACACSMLVLMARNISSLSIPRWLAAVGKVSFSIYIFHFLVWHVTEKVMRLPALNIVVSGVGALLFYVVVAFVAYGIAKISYKYIEKFFIGKGEEFIASRRESRLDAAFKDMPLAG